jgi:hypothetical protein
LEDCYTYELIGVFRRLSQVNQSAKLSAMNYYP